MFGGLLSKKLATILLDVPVTFQAEAYELTSPDEKAVNDLFEELEFRRMADNFKKLFKPSETDAAKTPSEPSNTR